jgi:hypothetical protein
MIPVSHNKKGIIYKNMKSKFLGVLFHLYLVSPKHAVHG